MNIRVVARQFAKPDDRRAWVELSATFLVYAGAIALAFANIGTWTIMLPAMALAAAAGLRLYMIQHDCLHRSFFSSRGLNDWTGRFLSPIAMTPFNATKHIHTQHHTHVSDLDRRDTFEIYVMTLAEWEQAGTLQRLQYRLYRSPITLIVLGPFLLYVIARRMPLYGLKTGIWDLVGHNLMVAAYFGGAYWLAGWPGVGVVLGAVFIATLFGSIIPYVLHNFEHIHWGTKPELDFETAALKGSSVLDWGALFDFVTLNIGYHDLHHLNAKIPGYKLKAAHRALERQGLIDSHKIRFLDGVRCLRWKLYDEDRDRMIGFPRRHAAQGVVPAE